MFKKKSRDEIIKKAKDLYGDRFDYSLYNGENVHDKCTIICKKHGEFITTMHQHLDRRGNGGCPECKKEKTSKTKRKEAEKFIEDAKEKYGNKYDLSKVNYFKSDRKITIICHEKDRFGREHGEFQITPNNFLRGRECPKCRKLNRRTEEEFIVEAKLVHGDKFDYNLINFKNMDTPIKIKCNTCGEIFDQTPTSHLQGNGCPNCKYRTISKKLSMGKEEFIKRAKEIHGDRYDYSKVDYKNNSTPVTIICPIHGEFKQKPINHLRGNNCPKCSHRSTKYTNEEFKERLKEIYGGTLDYSKDITYNGKKSNITLYCKEHGEFTKKASLVLQGHGCPKCTFKKKGDVHRLSTEEFIRKAREIHGDRFDYSKTEYKSMREPVTITCKIHGDFKQTPMSHLIGNGCQKCGIENRSEIFRLPKEEFVKRSNKVHNSKYDYSLVEYNNIHEKVKIICPIHGEFIQEAKLHMEGCGCPKCNSSKSEKEIEILLQENNINYIWQYKNKEIFGLKSIDYYLTDYNIAIECQGIQHFKPTKFGHKEESQYSFEYVISNDLNKYNECKNNHIDIIYYISNLPKLSKEKILKDFNPNGIYSNENLFDDKSLLMRKIKERDFKNLSLTQR